MTNNTEILNLLTHPQNLLNGESGINGRDVHRLLNVGRMYQHWIKARIKQAGFVEHQDFEIVRNLSIDLPKLASAKGGNTRQYDYIISLDMAKHLCLMEKNEIGKTIRQHFIQAESKLRETAPAVYKNTLAQTKARLESIDRNREMTDAIKASLQRRRIKPQSFHYSGENEMLDSLVLGENVRQWKAQRGIVGNVRDMLTTEQLEILKALQIANTGLIMLDMNYHERKGRLMELAERKRARLTQ